MNRTAAFLLFPLFLLLPLRSSPAGEESVLDRPVHLSLWGGSLDAAARTIKEQTGVDILFYLPDLPKEFTAANDVYMVTGQVTLGTALEGLARRFGFRFRVSRAGQVEISRSYGWVGREGALRFIRTPPLGPGGDPGGETRGFLREFIKPLELLEGDFSISLEPYPVPDNPAFLRGTVVMPQLLADYLERAVACLAGGDGDYPSTRPDPALFARARTSRQDWESFLARPVSSPRGVDIKSLLSDVADQAGVAILLRAPPSASGRGLPGGGERYTLGRVTEALATGWDLGRRVFLSSGAVVFEPGSPDSHETDSRSRELFWDGLAVAGFDVRVPAEAIGADALVPLLRREVFPDLWRDPVCSLVYSRATGRLVVVAPLNAVQAVGERLRSLR